MIRIIAAMLCTLLACLLIALGWSWDHLGYGLNPLAAYPLAALFTAAPIAAHLAEQ